MNKTIDGTPPKLFSQKFYDILDTVHQNPVVKKEEKKLTSRDWDLFKPNANSTKTKSIHQDTKSHLDPTKRTSWESLRFFRRTLMW